MDGGRQKVGERHVVRVGTVQPIAPDGNVRHAGLRSRHVRYLPARYFALGELEPVIVAHAAADFHRAASRPHHDGVSIHELKARERAFEEELVEVDFLQNLVSSLDRHPSVAPLPGVHSPGPAQEVEQRVGRHAGKAAGSVHVSSDIDDDRTRAFEIRVDVDVLGENGAHRFPDSGGKVAVSDSNHPDRADVGDEDVPLRVHHDDVGIVDRPPHPKRDVIAGTHQVVGIQPVLALPLEPALEELRSEGAGACFRRRRNGKVRGNGITFRARRGMRVHRRHGEEYPGRCQQNEKADSTEARWHVHNPM